MHVAATHANHFLFLLIFLLGKQKRRKTRKRQVIRTDSALKNPHHQVVIPEPFPEPFTLVTYASGFREKETKGDHEDDAH
jgi:hypothetical protein